MRPHILFWWQWIAQCLKRVSQLWRLPKSKTRPRTSTTLSLSCSYKQIMYCQIKLEASLTLIRDPKMPAMTTYSIMKALQPFSRKRKKKCLDNNHQHKEKIKGTIHIIPQTKVQVLFWKKKKKDKITLIFRLRGLGILILVGFQWSTSILKFTTKCECRTNWIVSLANFMKLEKSDSLSSETAYDTI